MAVDGYLNFDTKISTNGFDNGTAKITAKAKSTASEVTKTVSKTNSKIQAILEDTERSNKSKAASIAAIYRKEGMNISEAMEKAWSHIERGSAESAKKVSKNTRQISSSLSGLKPLLSKLAVAASALFSTYALVNFGKEAINIASDIQEVQNVVDVSFEALKGQMEAFADKAIETYGISKLTAKQTGSTYMAMAKGMQIADDAAAEMALTLTGLSADMASFYNKEQSVTATALNSVFTGETETLKAYGIIMTEANLQNFAYTQGINKKISAMSQAEKVQLRYNYVMQQTALAQGDFARTSDGWANQTRILTEQWREFSGTVGTILMNTLLPAVQSLNKAMLWLNSVAQSVLETLAAIFDWDIESSGGSASVYEDVSNAIGTSVDNQNALTDAVNETAKAQKRELMGFDKINKLSDDSSSSSEASNMGVTGGNTMAATMKLGADTSEAEKELTGFAAKVKTAWENGDYEGLGSLFATKVNSALSKFANEIDYEGIIEKVTPKITGIAEGINSFIDDVDWSLLSQGLSNSISLGLSTIDVTLDSLDFSVIGGAIGEFLQGIDIVNLAGDLGSLLSTCISSALDLVSGYIQSLDWSKIFNNIYEGIKNFFINIDWSEIFSSVAEFMGTTFGNALDLLFSGAELVEKIFEDIAVAFGSVGDYFDGYIEEAGGNIVLGIWNGITNALSNVWQWIKDNVFTPFMEGFKEAFGINSPAKEMEPMGQYIVDGIKAGIGNVWDKLSQSFVDMLTKTKEWFVSKKAEFSEAWNNTVSAVKDKTAKMKATVATKVEDLKKSWKTRTDVIKDKTAKAKLKFNETVKDIKTAAQKRYKAITDVFGGITTWFKDKFSEAWKKVKEVFSKGGDTFKAIKDGILTSLKSVINGLIDGINKVIKVPFDGINTALEKVKNISIAGATPFKDKIKTISVPKIPKLATGTVVPANYGEFLAVLGDNKREPEIVSPESAIRKVVSEEFDRHGGSKEEIFKIIVPLDGKVIYETMVKRNKQNTKQTGVNELATA